MNEQANRRRGVIIIICLASSLLALAFSGLVRSGALLPLERVETYTEDVRARAGRKTRVDPSFALVGVDRFQYGPTDFSDEALNQAPILKELQKGFPWSRAVWAELTDKLADAGARVIVFDMIFGAGGVDDERFRDVLSKHRDTVVVGCTITEQATERGGFAELVTPVESLMGIVDRKSVIADPRVGFVHVPLDSDRVVRRIKFHETAEKTNFLLDQGVTLESIASRALRILGRADAIPESLEPIRFRYGEAPGVGYRVHSVADVLNPKTWETNYGSGAFFKDKLVMIGVTGDIFNNDNETPFDERKMSGPELHLNVIAAALQGQFIREVPAMVSLVTIVLTGLLAGALSFHNFQPHARLGALFLSVTGYWLLAQWFYDQAAWVIPVAAPIVSLTCSAILILFYDFFQERVDHLKMHHTMGLYFSPTVLHAVLSDPGSMKSKHADVTLLLTDLRNSTPLAELLGPQGMFDLLNQSFEAQTHAIMAEHGNLEHFLGDQFLSYWGAPQIQYDAADRAFRAALALIVSMEALQKSLPDDTLRLFGYGVGLHCGRVLVGNKGSSRRMDYGLVGDSVNTASRLESLTKYYGVRLLVSGELFKQLTIACVHRLVDRVIVKGKSEPVEILECENACTPPDFIQLCEAYEKAYVMYAASFFNEAREQFESLVNTFSDGPSRVMRDRCEQLAAAPLSEWHGVWMMDAK